MKILTGRGPESTKDKKKKNKTKEKVAFAPASWQVWAAKLNVSETESFRRAMGRSDC